MSGWERIASVRAFFIETTELATTIQRNMDEQRGTLVIIRGMPGSGKTSFATELAYCVSKLQARFEICSADDFFYDNRGIYRYDRLRLHDVHMQCQERCSEAIRRGVDCVIIDNSNLGAREYDPFVNMAVRSKRYNVQLVEFDCRDPEQADELLRRTRHNIEQHVLAGKLAKYHGSLRADAIRVSSDFRSGFSCRSRSEVFYDD